MDQTFWKMLTELKESVGKALEPLRAQNLIGSSLDAEVELHCPEGIFRTLEPVSSELRFLLINSNTSLHLDSGLTEGSPIRIQVKTSNHAKCIRCWQHREDVGQDDNHPEICGRCIENVAGSGETRTFA
jgi:isoleucyl-tRNA synthetase